MPLHTKFERKKLKKAFKGFKPKIKIAGRKVRATSKRLKSDFIRFKKAPTIGTRIAETRKKLVGQLKKPKVKKIRKSAARRGRRIGQSLARPVNFDIF